MQNKPDNLENCPLCNSDCTIAIDDFCVEGSTVWRKVECKNCGTVYNEIFAIVKREIID